MVLPPDLDPDPEQPYHNPLVEEMIDLDLNPDEVSEESYLKARNMVVEGRLSPDRLVEKTMEFQKERDEKDEAIGIWLWENS